jgi:hypothetical protein
MNLTEYKIERLQELKEKLHSENEKLSTVIRQAAIKNKWFTPTHSWEMIEAIKADFLDQEKLSNWLANYEVKEVNKSLGLILAGNLPLVGFHDILCAFVLNVPLKVKLSEKDSVLSKYLLEELQALDITWQVEFVERLQDFEAVIATGSNNSNRYFEQYFQQVPRLLRKNRNSLAVIRGDESEEELQGLAHDALSFFGLGCRSISKIFIPKDYQVEKLFKYFDIYQEYINQHLYKDNYDYNRTLLLMNQTPHLANDFLMLQENESLQSRLATIHYSFYEHAEVIQNYIIQHHEDIQVVVSKENELWKSVAFGQAQRPSLSDYADHIDTIDFLLSL